MEEGAMVEAWAATSGVEGTGAETVAGREADPAAATAEVAMAAKEEKEEKSVAEAVVVRREDSEPPGTECPSRTRRRSIALRFRLGRNSRPLGRLCCTGFDTDCTLPPPSPDRCPAS